MTGSHRARSQSGLDRLLLFLVAVLVLVFVLPHALGLAGVDVRENQPSTRPTADHDLAILAARGEAIGKDRQSLGAVRLVVSPNPGRAPVDLEAGTALWITNRTHRLAPSGANGEGFDGYYRATAASGGGPVLSEPTERGVLVFDVGTDDVDGVEEFGSRLAPGDSVAVTLVTPAGETLTRRLSVPETLPAEGAVPL